MLDAVRAFIRGHALLAEGEAVTVAVSGGVDSMVLLHVLRALGHPVSVLHVDHGLRGAESDQDRVFVEQHALRAGIPCKVVAVDVHKAMGSGDSVQMAARRLRYGVFHDQLQQGGALALGHHRDDAVESLLMNLMRGTGPAGLAGIPASTPIASGRSVRPLLGVGRDEVQAYADKEGIPFREDGSNQSPKYLRNRVRHELKPLLEELRPGAWRAMGRSLHALEELVALGQAVLRDRNADLRADADGVVRIPVQRLDPGNAPRLVLQALLAGHGAHPDDLERLLEAVQRHSLGACFRFGEMQALLERDHLVIAPHREGEPAAELRISEMAGQAEGLSWGTVPAAAIDLGQGPRTAWLDADRLAFPLCLRPWRPGERMRPIGAPGSRKISDILTDAKLPHGQRPSARVLVSNGQIVWLAGHRVAEGFQAGPRSTRLFRIGLVGPA
jgi:tRNA(Ile)-lysidine synthase